MTMTPRISKIALTTHVACSVGWMGAVAGFLVLSIAAVNSRDAEVVRGAYLSMNLLGLYIIVTESRGVDDRTCPVLRDRMGLISALLGAHEIRAYHRCNRSPDDASIWRSGEGGKARSSGRAGNIARYRWAGNRTGEQSWPRPPRTPRDHNTLGIQTVGPDAIRDS